MSVGGEMDEKRLMILSKLNQLQKDHVRMDILQVYRERFST